MTNAPGFNTIEQFSTPEGGVLLVDKPSSWTSFDVVNKIRRTLRVRKVGHAGTLDPMATGLLILCSGRSTKSIDRYQALVKMYEGTMRLGAVTASYDAETPAENEQPLGDIAAHDIRDAAQRFTGDIEQLPPMYSAVKVKGQRLYKLARKGEEVERAPRRVHIARFDIEDVTLPDVRFTVVCSKGTYVRTLAHDLGQTLGCGAYLSSLRRTAIGTIHVADAWSIDELVTAARKRDSEQVQQENSHARPSES